MVFQIINLSSLKKEKVIIDEFDEMISYLEAENYFLQLTGVYDGQFEVSLLKGDDILHTKTVQLQMDEYTESLLAEFEPQKETKLGKFLRRSKRKLSSKFTRLKNFPSKLKSNFKKKTKKQNEGDENMSTEIKPKAPWEYDGEPLEEPATSPNPDASRAEILAKIGVKKTEPEQEHRDSSDIDYAALMAQQKAEAQAKETQPEPVVEEIHRPQLEKVPVTVSTESEFHAAPVYNTEATPTISQAPAAQPTSNLLNPATLGQENLVKHMAKISDEKAQIRQKILDNQALIEQAKRAEIENQSLEEELKNQEHTLQKLQNFHALFAEFADYLN